MASPNELSFLPDDYLERKAQRRTNVIFAILFLFVVVGIGSAFTITQNGVVREARANDQVIREYTEAAKRINQFQQLQEKQRRMSQQAELAASLLEKVPRSNLLATITNSCAPTGITLMDLTMESKLRPGTAGVAPSKSTFEAKRTNDPKAKAAAAAAAANAPKMYDVSLKITGIAQSDIQVAQFIKEMNNCKLFREVNLLITDEYKQSDEQLRKFQIEAHLDPKAEVADEKPKTAAVELKESGH